jgi:hypothetical protein
MDNRKNQPAAFTLMCAPFTFIVPIVYTTSPSYALKPTIENTLCTEPFFKSLSKIEILPVDRKSNLQNHQAGWKVS